MEMYLNAMLLAFCANLGLWLILGLVGLWRWDFTPARVMALVIFSPVWTVLALRSFLVNLLERLVDMIKVVVEEARYISQCL